MTRTSRAWRQSVWAARYCQQRISFNRLGVFLCNFLRIAARKSEGRKGLATAPFRPPELFSMGRPSSVMR